MENKDNMNKALELFKNEKYQEALDDFYAQLAESPEDNGILNNIGLCYYKLANDEKAEEFYIKALQQNNKAIETYVNLSDLYYKNRNLDKAIGLLENAVTLMPEDIVLLHYLARIYIEDVQYDLAFDILNRILELSPENIDAYWDLGNLCYETGDYQNAAAAFEHVIEKRDDNPIFFYQTALAYEAADDIDKAITNYLKTISVNSMMPQPYKRLGIMFLSRTDKESAKEYFQDYLKFDLPQEEKDNINLIITNLNK